MSKFNSKTLCVICINCKTIIQELKCQKVQNLYFCDWKCLYKYLDVKLAIKEGDEIFEEKKEEYSYTNCEICNIKMQIPLELDRKYIPEKCKKCEKDCMK